MAIQVTLKSYGSIVTPENNIIVTGACTENGTGDIPATSYAKENLFVAKLDENAKIIWLKLFGGSMKDQGQKVVCTSDGGYLIAGNSESQDGDVPSTNPGIGLWLLKLDANGNKIWSKIYGGQGDNEALSITATNDGGYIILGGSSVAGNDIPIHYTTSPFEYDWFVLKIDVNGNKEWLKVYGGNGDEDISGTILSTKDNYFIVGSSESIDHDCTDTVWHVGKKTLSDFYVLKLDLQGNIIWSKSYGSSKYENQPSAILDDADSSIVLTGITKGNDYMISGNNGDDDISVMKISKDGILLWQKCLGGIKAEMRPHISKLKNGQYSIYGQSLSTKLGGVDTWMFILDNQGNKLIDKVIGGDQYESPTSVLALKDYYLAVGTSVSRYFSEGVAISNHTRAGGTFLSKMYYFPTDAKKISNGYQELEIYPNPAHGKVKIEIPPVYNGTLEILSTSGKCVFKQQNITESKTYEVNVQDWPQGMYTVIWTNA